MSRLQLDELKRLCEQQGWTSGIRTFLQAQPLAEGDFWAQYILLENRAAAKVLLNLHRGARVLDCGCGTGTLAINYARNVREVVALDAGLSQVRLARIRMCEAGVHNVRVLCAGGWQHLPFPSESFDIVLLNGALEWVAKDTEGNPRAQQEAFLSEVNRLLKPEGQVYVGIENRLGYPYLIGMPDEHTALRFVTVLPRPLANLLSRLWTGKPYRVYTYTRRGYRKLLAEAGFRATRFYMPRPNYRSIGEFLGGFDRSLADDGFAAKTRVRGLQRNRLKAWLYPYLAHSFGMVAGKSRLPKSLVEHTIEQVQDGINLQLSEPLRLQPLRIRIGESGAALITVGDEDRSQAFILKIPLVPDASSRLTREFGAVGNLRTSLEPTSALRSLLPRPMLKLECAGMAVFVHQLCPGYDLRFCYRHHADRQQIFRLGLDFLLKLQRATGVLKVHQPTSWEAWLHAREEYLAQIASDKPEGWRPVLERIRDCFRESPPCSLWMHGDFWPGNLLSTEEGSVLTGVVDWTFADAQGFPLIDLLHLLLYTKGLASGKGFSSCLRERLAGRRFEKDEEPFVREYCEQLSISASSIWPLALAAWLDWIYHRTTIHGYRPSWLREITEFLHFIATTGPKVF